MNIRCIFLLTLCFYISSCITRINPNSHILRIPNELYTEPSLTKGYEKIENRVILLENSLSTTNSGNLEIGLINVESRGFLVPIEFSSQSGEFYLLLDLFSNWTYAINYEAAKSITNNRSSNLLNWIPLAYSGQEMTSIINIQYPEGKAQGNTISDDILLQNLNISNSEGSAAFVSSQLDPMIQDILYGTYGNGYLGFGQSSSGKLDLLESVLNDGYVSQAMFSLFLSFDPSNVDTLSKLIIGGWNENYLNDAGSLFSINVQNNSWTIQFNKAALNNEEVSIGNFSGILSTTIDGIALPDYIYSSIIPTFEAQGVPCSINDYSEIYCQCSHGNTENFPTINLMTGNQEIQIDPLYYTKYDGSAVYTQVSTVDLIAVPIKNPQIEYNLVSSSNLAQIILEGEQDSTGNSSFPIPENQIIRTEPIVIYNFSQYTDSSGKPLGDVCYLKIYNSENYTSTSNFNNIEDLILGIPFLQNYYTIFDLDNQTVTIGVAKQPIQIWSQTKSSSSSSNLGLIIGIVAGVVAGLIVALIFWYRRKRARAQSGPLHQQQVDEEIRHDGYSVNPQV